MNATFGIRMKNPAHPGGFVKSQIVEALDPDKQIAAAVSGGASAEDASAVASGFRQ